MHNENTGTKGLNQFLLLSYIIGSITLILLLPTPTLYVGRLSMIIWLYFFIPILMPLAGFMGVVPFYIFLKIWESSRQNSLFLPIYYSTLILSILIQVLILYGLLKNKGELNTKNIYIMVATHHIYTALLTSFYIIDLSLKWNYPVYTWLVSIYPLAINMAIVYLIYKNVFRNKNVVFNYQHNISKNIRLFVSE